MYVHSDEEEDHGQLPQGDMPLLIDSDVDSDQDSDNEDKTPSKPHDNVDLLNGQCVRTPLLPTRFTVEEKQQHRSHQL